MHRILRTLLVFVLLTAAGFAAEDLAATKKKAEAGDVLAQYRLGVINLIGGGEGDYAEGVKWYRKAAEQGYAPAQARLGSLYRFGGIGVLKDYAEALKWYRLAAEQGDASAQCSLGNMYYYGTGEPKDLVQAHVWLNIALANGDTMVRGLAGIVLESAEQEMTPDQIAEAMKLARELFAKQPKGKPIL